MQGLNIAMYHVGDLRQAKEWYTTVLGVLPSFDQPFYVGFDVNGSELGLTPSTENGPKGPSVYAYWRVEDIQADYARLLSFGAGRHKAVQDVGEGILVATVMDPWGNVLGLVQRPVV